MLRKERKQNHIKHFSPQKKEKVEEKIETKTSAINRKQEQIWYILIQLSIIIIINALKTIYKRQGLSEQIKK